MANKEEFIIPLAVAKDAPTIEAKCITCQNGMTLSRCSRFPICDDCLKDLREIIKERRIEKEKAEFKLKVKKRCAELERKYGLQP